MFAHIIKLFSLFNVGGITLHIYRSLYQQHIICQLVDGFSSEIRPPNTLISFYLLLQNPHLVMHRPTYTVGQSRESDLWIGDSTVSKDLCNLKHTETEVSLSFS